MKVMSLVGGGVGLKQCGLITAIRQIQDDGNGLVGGRGGETGRIVRLYANCQKRDSQIDVTIGSLAAM